MIYIFAELKRRSVFRVAGVYAVVGWLLMQAAALFENSMHLPAWFDSAVTAALLLGFPIAILLAWAFEMTPEGVKRTDALEGETVQAGRKMDGVIIAGLVGVLALGAYQQMTKPDVVYRDAAGEVDAEEVAPQSSITIALALKPEIDDASIAVLPFADLSPEGDQEYFSDGISEELLNVLVRVEGLKVASRTSSFAFKGQGTLSIPHIAGELNVRHVLEGSVRKSGDTIRITAQLIDANTDVHLWSDTYDRTLTTENIFGIQDEISKAIVTALRETLGAELGEAKMPEINTENLDAYELYLKAHLGFLDRRASNIPTTISLFEQSVAADPGFARAWAGLAAVRSVAPSWGVNDQDYLALADVAARKAIVLDPDLALPYAVLGNNLTYGKPADYSDIFKYYDKSLAADPKNSTVLLWRGISRGYVGYFELAKNDYNACLKIDPGYTNCRRYLALALLYNGETELAFDQFDIGVLKGQVLMPAFSHAFAAQGDHRSTRLSLAWSYRDLEPKNLEKIYNALMDPNFDYDKAQLSFESEYMARTGDPVDWSARELWEMKLYLRKYEGLYPHQEVVDLAWWDRNLPHFFVSPQRKTLIRDLGIYDYWRVAGFPSQCRAVGTDDFECD